LKRLRSKVRQGKSVDFMVGTPLAAPQVCAQRPDHKPDYRVGGGRGTRYSEIRNGESSNDGVTNVEVHEQVHDIEKQFSRLSWTDSPHGRDF
jgi:hypothetical protein